MCGGSLSFGLVTNSFLPKTQNSGNQEVFKPTIILSFLSVVRKVYTESPTTPENRFEKSLSEACLRLTNVDISVPPKVRRLSSQPM